MAALKIKLEVELPRDPELLGKMFAGMDSIGQAEALAECWRQMLYRYDDHGSSRAMQCAFIRDELQTNQEACDFLSELKKPPSGIVIQGKEPTLRELIDMKHYAEAKLAEHQAESDEPICMAPSSVGTKVDPDLADELGLGDYEYAKGGVVGEGVLLIEDGKATSKFLNLLDTKPLGELGATHVNVRHDPLLDHVEYEERLVLGNVDLGPRDPDVVRILTTEKMLAKANAAFEIGDPVKGPGPNGMAIGGTLKNVFIKDGVCWATIEYGARPQKKWHHLLLEDLCALGEEMPIAAGCVPMRGTILEDPYPSEVEAGAADAEILARMGKQIECTECKGTGFYTGLNKTEPCSQGCKP